MADYIGFIMLASAGVLMGVGAWILRAAVRLRLNRDHGDNPHQDSFEFRERLSTRRIRRLNGEMMSYGTETTTSVSTLFDRLCQLKKNSKFADREYRHATNEVEIRRGVRAQIRAMRESRGWSQEQLGAAIKSGGKEQPNLSRLENGREGYFRIQTLLDIAEAFDVGLIVRFVPFSELAEWTTTYSADKASPADYSAEISLAEKYETAVSEGAATGTVR